MTKKINFGKLLYFTAALISLSLFIFTTVELIVDYFHQKTGFNIVEHDKTKLELPAATICITDTFQNVDIDGTETSPEEILSNLTAHTFSGNHIFYEDFEKLKEQYAIQETFSYKNGRCFTLTTSENQIKNAIGKPPMYLKLKKAHKYKISLHEAGGEMWLQNDLKPSKITSFEIDGTKMEEDKVGYIDINLTMMKITNQNRADYRCDIEQSLQSFTQCSFNIFSKIFHAKNYSCSAMILKVNTTLGESNICQDFDSFIEMKGFETDLMDTILVQKKYKECLRPCEKMEYIGSMTLLHQNSKKLAPYQYANASQFVGVLINYDSFLVQEQQEYFILDENELVSNIGGFLGMFLGLSTLSIAEWIHLKLKH